MSCAVIPPRMKLSSCLRSVAHVRVRHFDPVALPAFMVKLTLPGAGVVVSIKSHIMERVILRSVDLWKKSCVKSCPFFVAPRREFAPAVRARPRTKFSINTSTSVLDYMPAQVSNKMEIAAVQWLAVKVATSGMEKVSL